MYQKNNMCVIAMQPPIQQPDPMANPDTSRKSKAQKRSVIVAYLDMILNSLACGLLAVLLAIVQFTEPTTPKANYKHLENEPTEMSVTTPKPLENDLNDFYEDFKGSPYEEEMKTAFTIFILRSLAFSLLYIYLAHFLLRATKRRDYKMVNWWLLCHGLLYVWTIFMRMQTLFVMSRVASLQLFTLIYRAVTISIVLRFRSELKRERDNVTIQRIVYLQGHPDQFQGQGPSQAYFDVPPPYSEVVRT